MVATINASVSSSGLVTTADGSGIVKLQSNGKTTNALGWINFDGTLTSPITSRTSYNMSTVTKNGTGDYTLNFTNSMSDANYVYNVSLGQPGYVIIPQISTSTGAIDSPPTTSSCRFVSDVYNASYNVDTKYTNVAIFGN